MRMKLLIPDVFFAFWDFRNFRSRADAFGTLDDAANSKPAYAARTRPLLDAGAKLNISDDRLNSTHLAGLAVGAGWNA